MPTRVRESAARSSRQSLPRNSPRKSPPRRSAPIVLLTDFGARDHYVGVMKGVIATIAPAAPIIDLTHGIPAQSVIAGAIALRQSWHFFPRHTIFVAVVDPGVGTERLPIAVATRAGGWLVGPDNGLLALAATDAGVRRIVELRSPRYRLAAVSATFHGRDVFAPAAAHLWDGVPARSLGPRRKSMVPLELPATVEKNGALHGEIIYQDGFGNLISNISRVAFDRFAACFHAQALSVRIKGIKVIEIRHAYGDVRKGAPVAMFGSFDMLEIAIRDGNAAHRLGAGPGAPVSVQA